jgi:hypothetical protein
MRTRRFLFIMSVVGTLTIRAAGEDSEPARQAEPSRNRAQTTSDRSSDPQAGVPSPVSQDRPHAKNANGKRVIGPRSINGNPARLQPPQRFPLQPNTKRANAVESLTGTGNHLRPVGSDKSASALKDVVAGGKLENQRGQPAVSQALRPSAELSLASTHGRATGSVFIGGPVIKKGERSAVLNGTGMQHRP